MSEHTHRYTGTGLSRADGPDVEPGDRCTPTDAELTAFGDLFEPVAGADDTQDGDDDADGSEATTAEPTPPDELPSLSTAKQILADAGIEYDEYRALQSAASEYDDIAGNMAQPQLQRAIAAKLRE